jgi:alpha-L-fucosidase 2
MYLAKRRLAARGGSLLRGLFRQHFPLAGSLLVLALTTSAAELRELGPATPARDMVLWYRQPAVKWLEALPLGNGLIGAMAFGRLQDERIALNESTFWSGRPHDYDDPEAGKYFAQIRDLVFAGQFQEAEKVADARFYGKPAAQQAFQPLGDLRLIFDGVERAEDYRRELDLETGVVRVTYRAGDARFTREVFVSYPDRVMVVRITCDQPRRVSVRAQLESPYRDKCTARPGKLFMDGCWQGPIPLTNWLIAPVEGRGLRFQTALLARPEGGETDGADSSLRIRQADAVTFILAAATSFVNYRDISGDPAAACEKTLAAIADKNYATLRRRHEADFRALMGRVRLNVGDRALNEKPTDERLKALRDGGRDPNLEALCFQFGRYLLAASSRAGGQPANLQGIWNEAVSPTWGSKYTININTEMNYWPAEVCNLAECHQPLFEMLKDASVTWAKTARIYYGCNGWVAHHNLDLWRGTAPVDAARYGMWPVGGAWLCQHLWEHYAFSGDRRFLKEYYPVMKGAAQFLLEVMVEEPKHHWLVTPFSMSPEHGYLDNDGKMAFLSPSPTMDVALIRELFPHCIEAGRILGVDKAFRGQLEAALKRLPPYQVSRRGHLQEWIEDWQPGNQGHNMSPHFTFYPGSSITLRGTPELAAALVKGMEARRSRGGWPLAWDICMWARLERGDQVGNGVQTLVRNSLAPNLHNSGANQSDASFGLTAGIAEALLQSHAGEISLLPALPAHWSDGSVSGLRARGGFEVAIQWKSGKLRSAELSSPAARDCKVRCGAKTALLSLKPGVPVRLNAELNTAN